MADLRISELPALLGADLGATDLLPIVDVSASETKKITIQDAIGKGVTLIADATIPGAKILFSAGTIAGTNIANGGISATKLASDSVTAAKLADESTVDLVTTLPGSGAFVGQLALDTDDSKVYCWNGSTWVSFKAAGSINTVVGDSAGIVNLSIATSGDTVTITTSLDNTGTAAQFLAGPTASAGAVSYRQIASGDLPTASTSGKGAVVVDGAGLTMSGNQIVIDNTISASGNVFGVVQYSTKGLVTAGRAITAADLPAATSVDKGAVVPGTGLTAGGGGTLNHSNAVTAGTASKVTFDAQGHITAAQSLLETDIPNLPASKINSGTLSVSLLGTNSITGDKLADNSTVQFGGANNTAGVVTFPVAQFKGQMFFDALNGDLYLYDGAAYQPITITAGELIYAGTYNANLNQVKSVTAAGTAAGLVVGSALPAASNSNLRYYVVVSDSGTGTAPAPAVALAPPDMCVSSGTAWELIDVSNAIAGQIASNISFTPYGGIAATNVQIAIQELDDEKLAKAGGTVTGNLEIGTAGSLTFEGSTADAYETTLTVVDPTADRTITFPNVTGTVITTGDTGSVTSTMIADATIGNADINPSAAIAYSKLANLTAGNVLLGNASNVPTSTTLSGDVTLNSSGVATVVSGTTSTAGKLQLTNSTSSTSTSTAATPNSVKSAYDLANAALPKTGGTITGNLNISSGVVSHALGIAGAPTVTFTGDIDTGIFSPGSDQIAISTNSVERLKIGTSEVVFNDAGNDIDFRVEGDTNANLLFVDASTDRVGIGTSSPASNVHVASTGNTSIRISSSFSNSPETSLQIDTTGDSSTPKIVFLKSQIVRGGITYNHSATGAAERLDMIVAGGSAKLSILGSGNVGIGTSSPSKLLEISSSTDATIRINDPATIGSVDRYIGGVEYYTNDASGGAKVACSIKGYHVDISGSGRLQFATGSETTAMTIDGAQRVGIGTETPGVPLDVVGAIRSTSGTIDARLQAGYSGAVGIGAQSNDAVLFIQNATERARIDSSGGFRVKGAGAAGVNDAFFVNGSAPASSVQVDSSGRLLVGTSSALAVNTVTAGVEIHSTTTTNGASISVARFNNDQFGPALILGKSRNSTVAAGTIVQNNDEIGQLVFSGDDGTDLNTPAARIAAFVDGTPGSNDMPGRLMFLVTADGASSPTEALRITNDRVICYNQPDVTSIAAAATLTVAQLKTGIIQYTGIAATLTLPTGTLTEGGFALNSLYTNFTFEYSVINTGSGTCTIGAGTNHTIVGAATIAAGASGRFAARRTASNTFISYRLS